MLVSGSIIYQQLCSHQQFLIIFLIMWTHYYQSISIKIQYFHIVDGLIFVIIGLLNIIQVVKHLNFLHNTLLTQYLC